MSHPHKKLYNSAQWNHLRTNHLAHEPFCVMCRAQGFHNDGTRTATGEPQRVRTKRHLVADHITPHKGDPRLFYDPANIQTLCPEHHYGDKQRDEQRGFSDAIGADGWPSDPKHPANAKRHR